jgi:hypothetical protein
MKGNAKLMNTRIYGLGQGATDSLPKPGDFPLGSPESRAAARALLQRRTALSPYEADCRVLYSCTVHLRGDADPDSSWMQTTEVYKRGRVISERIDPPLIPSHLDPEYERRTFASICFWMIHDRVPRPGDILRFEELAAVWSEENVNAKVQRIQGAWARRLSEPPCPFKGEDGNMLIRQRGGRWKVEEMENALYMWSLVEEDALDRHDDYSPEPVIPEHPTIPAVVFIESKDGKRRAITLETTGNLPGLQSGAESALAKR